MGAVEARVKGELREELDRAQLSDGRYSLIATGSLSGVRYKVASIYRR